MEGKRILIVEDDEQLLETFRTILVDEGYDTDTATTGLQAIEKVANARYDLLVLDIKLPDIMGDKVARKIRRQDEQIAIIVITGFPSLQDSIEALDVGIHDILLKPISASELVKVVGEALARE